MCLCEELCLQRTSSSRRDREEKETREKWRDGEDRAGRGDGVGDRNSEGKEKGERIRLNDWER